MEQFDADRRCPKCSHDDVTVVYHHDAHETGCILDCPGPRFSEACNKFEHFCRFCRRCKYEWAERLPESVDA